MHKKAQYLPKLLTFQVVMTSGWMYRIKNLDQLSAYIIQSNLNYLDVDYPDFSFIWTVLCSCMKISFVGNDQDPQA